MVINARLSALTPMAITNMSNSGKARRTMDSWPRVKGSNDPGNNATRFPSLSVHCDVFIILVN